MNTTMTRLATEILSGLSVVLRAMGLRGRFGALGMVAASVLLLLSVGCRLGIFTELPSPVDLDTAQAQVPFKIRLPAYVSPSLDPKPSITVAPHAGVDKSVSILYESRVNLSRSFVLYETDNSSAKFTVGLSGRAIQVRGTKAMLEEREGDRGKEVFLQWIEDWVHYSIVATDLATDEVLKMANSLFEQ